MPPYNFPIELLTHTSTLTIAQESPAQKPAQAPPKPNPKPGPMDEIAHWPPEMTFIINRYPEIRFALLEALDKEVKLGHLKC